MLDGVAVVQVGVTAGNFLIQDGSLLQHSPLRTHTSMLGLALCNLAAIVLRIRV